MSKRARPSLIARFGGRSHHAGGGHLRSSIDELSSADFTLTSAQAEGEPVEYLAPLDVEIGGDVVFSGSTTRARVRGDEVAIDALSGVELQEGLMSEMAAHDIPTQDVVYAAAREAGFDDDHLNIHGLDELPSEVFEILVPVEAVRTTTRQRVGDITILPASEAAAAVSDFEGAEHLIEEIATADAAALVLVTTHVMHGAERDGLARIDLALAALGVRARYGWSRLPDGRATDFDRASAHALPGRLDVVAVRGLASGRRWLRRPSFAVRLAALDVDQTALSALYDPEIATVTDRQALLAAARAFRGNDALQRIQALWEAFDAYAEPPPSDELFPRRDRRRVLKATKKILSEKQQERLRTLVNDMANQPTLKTRLSSTLQREGVTFDAYEWNLLWNRQTGLRQVRNDSVHGGVADLPTPAAIDHACALLARALLHRLWRRRHEADQRLG